MALERVGASNTYQIRTFIFFALQWMVAAFILLSPPFLFMNPTANCPEQPGLSSSECMKQVCSLPESEQANHLSFTNIAGYTPFSKYNKLYCAREYLNTLLSSMSYLGSFMGFMVFPMIADNVGRRIGLILAWGTCTIGCILMASSVNYPMMIIGYFLAGFGVNPAVTLHYSFINEHSRK
jgi:OCT family organic cation transporter-like MFS transporter 4/5